MNRKSAFLSRLESVPQPPRGPRRLGFTGAFWLALALCAASGRADTNAVPGRVLYFSMDELRDGAFLDLTTSNAIGRATNARATSNGKLAGACEFSAKNSYVQVPDSPALNPKQLTLSVWFKNGKEAWASRTLLEKGVERGYSLSIAGGGKENARKGKLRASVCGQACLSEDAVNDDLWHHAAATFDGKTLKLFLDGALQKQTASITGELVPNTYDLTLGMHRSAPSSQDKEIAFDGLLDEVMLFNRALETNEIKRVRSSAKPKFTKWQVERRVKELKELLDRGLILQDFYDRKMEECEVVD